MRPVARFEIPAGWTAQGYRFALDPTPKQVETLCSHAGGARFAYNTMLAAVKANLEQRAAERSYGIAENDLTPSMNWSFQSLRNDWNRRKHTVAVGADGTPWWPQNSKEVYANACGRCRNHCPIGVRPAGASGAGRGWDSRVSRRKPMR